jgi:hypothetical protein
MLGRHFVVGVNTPRISPTAHCPLITASPFAEFLELLPLLNKRSDLVRWIATRFQQDPTRILRAPK